MNTSKIIKGVVGGGRASTSLRPCKIDGWSILDSIGGKVTHRSVKTDNGVVIVEVSEE